MFFFQLVLQPPFFKRKNQRAAFEDDACIVNSGTQNAGVRGRVGVTFDGQESHQGVSACASRVRDKVRLGLTINSGLLAKLPRILPLSLSTSVGACP